MFVIELDGVEFGDVEWEWEEEVTELAECEKLAVLLDEAELVDVSELNLLRLLGRGSEWREVLLSSADRLMSDMPVLGRAGEFLAGGGVVVC